MSVTALIWVILASVLLVLSLKRAIWALALYLLTLFAAPHLWWWGREVPSARYALWSGVLLLAAVLYRLAQPDLDDVPRRWTVTHAAAIGMVLNATFVHLVLATSRAISIDTYTELAKYTLLFFLMWRAVATKSDFRVALIALAIGAGYIGYEVTINERGNVTANRLEGIGAPGATTSNGLASLLLTILPLSGALLIDSKVRHKIVVVAAAPLILNVMLLCNSRGTFLGLVFAAIMFFLLARGPTRKKAIRALAVGSVALYLLLGDPRILERFLTTFSGSEERDASAASRIDYWRAGLAMLVDYPLGAGGGAFKFIYAAKYTAEVTGVEEERSIHNGFLTEGTDWGVQGMLLKVMFIGTGLAAAYRTSVQCRKDGRSDDCLIGICVITSACGFLVTCLFGSFLNNEWAFWVTALLVRYSELYTVQQATEEQATPFANPGVRSMVAPPETGVPVGG